jgi:hypothetical protein
MTGVPSRKIVLVFGLEKEDEEFSIVVLRYYDRETRNVQNYYHACVVAWWSSQLHLLSFHHYVVSPWCLLAVAA